MSTEVSSTVTVVVNTYQRSKELVSRSLKSSLKQSHLLDQVILIDQNPKELRLEEDIVNHPKFKRIRSESTCVSSARNSLLKEDISSHWIIFCDDDGYFDSDYIKTFKEIVKSNQDIKIFAGSIIRDDNFEFYSPRQLIGGSLDKFFNTKLLMGSNFCVQTKVFKLLNGFDERFGAGSKWGSGEETDFAWKAYFSGVSMKYAPELRVLHIKPYANNFKQSCQKAYRYGKGKGALVSKWLFEKRKLKVLIELIEMLTLPFIQFLKKVLFLDFKSSIYPFFSLSGRTVGFILMSFNIFNKRP